MKPLRIAFVLVGLVQLGACAVGSEVDGPTDGTGGIDGVGGTGEVPGAGGTLGSTGGTLGSTGGTLGSTGGTLGSTGGTLGSGGTTGAQQDSTFANNGYGTSGDWEGYLFTAVDTNGSTVSPVCGATGTCYSASAKKVCAQGSLTAADDSFVMIGFNLNQGVEPPNDPGTWTSSGSGVTVTVANPGNTDLRIKVDVGSTEYCASLAKVGTSQTIPWESFKTSCWTTGGSSLPVGSALTAIAVQVPGKAASVTPYNYCLVSIALAP